MAVVVIREVRICIFNTHIYNFRYSFSVTCTMQYDLIMSLNYKRTVFTTDFLLEMQMIFSFVFGKLNNENFARNV